MRMRKYRHLPTVFAAQMCLPFLRHSHDPTTPVECSLHPVLRLAHRSPGGCVGSGLRLLPSHPSVVQHVRPVSCMVSSAFVLHIENKLIL